jgi:hypothetical protein
MRAETFDFADDLRVIPDAQFSGLLGVHGDTVARKDRRIASGEEVDDLWPRPIQISAKRKGRRASDVRKFLAAKSAPLSTSDAGGIKDRLPATSNASASSRKIAQRRQPRPRAEGSASS